LGLLIVVLSTSDEKRKLYRVLLRLLPVFLAWTALVVWGVLFLSNHAI
jgi:hypothetical protein